MADDRESKPASRTYTQEEVNEILQRALEVQGARQNRLRHDELVEIAGEVGIDRDALDAALADMAQRRATQAASEAERRELAAERRRHWRGYLIHFATYVLVNLLLFEFDRHFTGGVWFYWVLLGWGIGVVSHFLHVLMPSPGWEEKYLLKRARRARRKAQLEAARQRWESLWEGKWETMAAPPGARARRAHRVRSSGRMPGEAIERGAREFERAVEDGVAALLNVAARKIREHAGSPAEAEPNFRAAPRTRVEATEAGRSEGQDESAEPRTSERNDGMRGATR